MGVDYQRQPVNYAYDTSKYQTKQELDIQLLSDQIEFATDACRLLAKSTDVFDFNKDKDRTEEEQMRFVQNLSAGQILKQVEI